MREEDTVCVGSDGL
ncbi:hypothetical protein CC1_08620 [Coprococcus catus GD/7]|nr:hypothetical protein CC1_08620 [Coprococcus catus GD/7]